MSFISPHKFWLIMLSVAIALMFFSAPLLGYLRNEASQRLAEIEDARTKTQGALQKLDDDIAATQKLSGQIGEGEVERSLAYIDRLQAIDLLEKQAADARLDHFTYTLSPEKKTTVNNPGAGIEELAISAIAVKAEVPLDTDAYKFVERIRSLMPGRLRLQSFTLERIRTESTPLHTNLRLTANFEWLSNGTAKQMAEGK